MQSVSVEGQRSETAVELFQNTHASSGILRLGRIKVQSGGKKSAGCITQDKTSASLRNRTLHNNGFYLDYLLYILVGSQNH